VRWEEPTRKVWAWAPRLKTHPCMNQTRKDGHPAKAGSSLRDPAPKRRAQEKAGSLRSE